MTSPRRQQSQQGFALVVVSALFIAFAVIAAAFIDRSNATQQMNQQEQTRAQLSRISTALLQYYLYNNFLYPCPADPAYPSTDTTGNYGNAYGGCSSATVNSTDTALRNTANTADTGIQVLNGSSVTNQVVRGSLPVNALTQYGLDPNDAIDLWNNKIMYVVNRNLTVANGVGSAPMSVTNPSTGTTYIPPDFIVISYGRDGVGAYGKNSSSIGITCPAVSTSLRQNNCDGDLSFTTLPVLTTANVSASAYFDDMLSFYAASSAPCAGQTVAWGTGCSYSFPQTANGATSGPYNTTDGSHSGSASATCANGAMTVNSSTATCVTGTNNAPVCGTTAFTCTTGTASLKYSNTCNYGYAGGWSDNTWECTYNGTSENCTSDYHSTCFLSDVAVTLEDGTTKPISELQVGDAVRGHTRINHVLHVPTYTSDQAVYGFNGGKKFVTAGHPFYTAHGWKAIDPALTPKEGHNVKTTKLKIGDVLLTDKGAKFVVHSIEREESGDHDLFSPMMDGDHTYYANGLLVHNKLAGTPPNGSDNPCIYDTSTAQ